MKPRVEPDIEGFRKILYVSVDIETDGPVAGINNMLSLAGVAITLDKEVISTFSRNLLPLPDTKPDQDTMERFWAKETAAWAAVNINRVEPQDAMRAFFTWLTDLRDQYKKIVLVGSPASFDCPFVTYYLARFVGYQRLSWLDLKSFNSGYKKSPFHKSGKKYMPKRWWDVGLKHTHIAIDDAHEQAALLINIFREMLALRTIK